MTLVVFGSVRFFDKVCSVRSAGRGGAGRVDGWARVLTADGRTGGGRKRSGAECDPIRASAKKKKKGGSSRLKFRILATFFEL